MGKLGWKSSCVDVPSINEYVRSETNGAYCIKIRKNSGTTTMFDRVAVPSSPKLVLRWLVWHD